MGCLNSENNNFGNWFGNIHLSGPCNRKCYFCIGQHMMALDKYNVLNQWPLPGIDDFLAQCEKQEVDTVNLTGTNTDPLLYNHLEDLNDRVQDYGLWFGVRTNAVAHLERLEWFDKGSITICSLNPEIYRKMMGLGNPPDIEDVLHYSRRWTDIKINIVLGPENVLTNDVFKTVLILSEYGIDRINLREPYGQPHVGNPFKDLTVEKEVMGMPTYKINDKFVTYWDVHYVEVESVNLYANGRVSLTYPITKGCSDNGIVLDQSHFPGGRVQEQWIK